MEKVHFIFCPESGIAKRYTDEVEFIKTIMDYTERKYEFIAYTAKRLVSNTEEE